MALLPYIMLCQHAKWTNARPPAFTAASLRSLKWHVRTYSVMVVKSAADGMFQRVFTVLWVWLVPRVCTIWGNPTHACQWKQQQQQQHFDSKEERKCWKTSLFWSQVVWRWSLRSSLTCWINKKRDICQDEGLGTQLLASATVPSTRAWWERQGGEMP